MLKMILCIVVFLDVVVAQSIEPSVTTTLFGYDRFVGQLNLSNVPRECHWLHVTLQEDEWFVSKPISMADSRHWRTDPYYIRNHAYHGTRWTRADGSCIDSRDGSRPMTIRFYCSVAIDALTYEHVIVNQTRITQATLRWIVVFELAGGTTVTFDVSSNLVRFRKYEPSKPSASSNLPIGSLCIIASVLLFFVLQCAGLLVWLCHVQWILQVFSDWFLLL